MLAADPDTAAPAATTSAGADATTAAPAQLLAMAIPGPVQPDASMTTASADDPTAADPTAADTAPASSETVSSLAGQTASRASSGASQFQVELHPLDLGKVNVAVAIGAGGALSAAFTFDKPQAAEALGARAVELQKALEQAGFSVSTSALSFTVAHAASASAQAAASTPSSQTNAAPSGAFGQSLGQGAGQGAGEGARQEAQLAFGRSGGRAFAAAAETLGAADQPRTSAYASHAARGVDIRI